MNAEIYGFASGFGLETGLIRFGGMGLGNLLFSWARCSLFCDCNGAIPIYTTWPQFKRRAWTHWEADKRHYLGVFRPLADEVSGLSKLRLLYSLPKVSEEHWTRTAGSGKRIVLFRGLRNYFEDIPLDKYHWLRYRFFATLADQNLIKSNAQPHIGVHVRLGDFFAYDPNAKSFGNMKLPIEWYVKTLQRISSELAWAGEIGVCSDSNEQELSPLLRLPNVRLVKGQTAQEDLMYLAQSQLLIGSSSTFSQWAAYLSGRPSVWHPTFDRKGGLRNGSFEMVMSGDSLPNHEAWKNFISEAASSGSDIQPVRARSLQTSTGLPLRPI